ncbi:MAG: OmpA family protein [Flavobacteriales bacterium]|nr:OmpA family protein [Flavobacteriales bacterium]
MYFDYNSSTIAPQSIPSLVRIGQALADPRLSEYRFLIAGHTDGAGGRLYNHALSERRAASVRDFLIKTFPLVPQKLTSIGFGYEQLKVPESPLAAVNRRVELINIGN